MLMRKVSSRTAAAAKQVKVTHDSISPEDSAASAPRASDRRQTPGCRVCWDESHVSAQNNLLFGQNYNNKNNNTQTGGGLENWTQTSRLFLVLSVCSCGPHTKQTITVSVSENAALPGLLRLSRCLDRYL